MPRNEEAQREAKRRWYHRNKEANREKTNEAARAYHHANKEKRAAYQKKWREANKEKVRAYDKTYAPAYRRKRVYGLTDEEFYAMVSAQEGACAACKTVFSATPHIDHCHATGKVRGLLCRSCNTALGLLRDNVETLDALKEYLLK
jgi:hypothetical protein